MMRLADVVQRFYRRMVPETLEESPQEALRRTAAHWGAEAGTWQVGRGLHWTEHPVVQERINRKVSGNPAVDSYLYFLDKYLAGHLPVERSLTLGCGDGSLERGLVKYNFARHYEGVDAASDALRRAEELAPREGPSAFSYRGMDLNILRLEAEQYDVIFGVNSVHHVENLEQLFIEARRALKPGGYLHLNEYVGPSRFQWTERQLDAVNGLLMVLPERYRIDLKDTRTVKTRLGRPTVEQIKAIDPSEAVRSAEIVRVLRGYFELIDVKEYGGTILHPLLDSIAGNFDPEKAEDRTWIEWLFQAEDALLAAGDVSSDFVVVIATK